MASIKALEASSIHRIQSGQVIVDLCSVAKELVENSLDAGAASVDVRFKNYGLDCIEVQDNGNGIRPEDYETVALKHYTSKLSDYDGLSTLQSFGFRGEALSSLCALSKFHIVTARAGDGAKGVRLDFEASGKLKGTTVVASQKGTTVAVENIFANVPVRRRELDKNIKREFSKVLGLLHAYACVSTGVRFSVSNHVPKGKKVVQFSTNSNPTTRENIANVYGAKTLLALIPLDLNLELKPTVKTNVLSSNHSARDAQSRQVRVLGHISRPTCGEGRQTPDRQMFFVNSRPCGLPQVAKAINEVYKAYNVTQSPFVFADLVMDTNAYDVNVSPDKRTILLHDQNALLESLKENLLELFDAQEQSVPQAQLANRKLSAYTPLSVKSTTQATTTTGSQSESTPEDPAAEASTAELVEEPNEAGVTIGKGESPRLVNNFASRTVFARKLPAAEPVAEKEKPSKEKQRLARSMANSGFRFMSVAALEDFDEDNDDNDGNAAKAVLPKPGTVRQVQDFNQRMASQEARALETAANARQNGSNSTNESDHASIPATSPAEKAKPGMVTTAYNRVRPRRASNDLATITIGDSTTITNLRSPTNKRRKVEGNSATDEHEKRLFGQSLRAFAAPGTQVQSSTKSSRSDAEESDEAIYSETGEVDVASNPSTSLDQRNRDDEDEDENQVASSTSQTVSAEKQNMEDDSDTEYLNENEKRAREEAKVARMVALAEEAAARPTQDNAKRAVKVLKGGGQREPTLELIKTLEISVTQIERQLSKLTLEIQSFLKKLDSISDNVLPAIAEQEAEERLSLTVSKADFARMRVVGQFNLGFILAVRPSVTAPSVTASSDQLFIIDQHAADEKYNFERLQSSTIVQNQRLVQPRVLDLTAIEEEIILAHPAALANNGFVVEIDTSGVSPVGRRCKLLSLPMSKEVIFNIKDLEELLVLLGEQGSGQAIPRPSRVRRMFAMRACRSSIMVGKSLFEKQMATVMRHMGEIDKPWNCPHGRPTMRHLSDLDAWDGWSEGMGVVGLEEHATERSRLDWKNYAAGQQDDDGDDG